MARRDIEAGKAFVALNLKDSAFVKGLRRAQRQVQDFGAKVAKFGAAVAATGATIVAAMGKAVQSFARVGDELDKMSQRTGVAVSTLAELGFAAESSGASLDAVERTILKMNRRLGRATSVGGPAKAAMEELGLSIDELRKMNPEERFLAIGEAIRSYGDDAAAAGLAQRAFGVGVDKLLPLFKAGREGIEKLRQEARDLGIVPSDRAVKAAAEVTDALARIRRVASAITFEIGNALAGSVVEAAERIKNFLVTVNQWIKDNQQLVVTIGKIGAVLLAAGTAIATFGGALAGVGAVLGGIASGLTAIGTLVSAWPLIPVLAAATAAAATLSAGVVALGVAFKNALSGEHGEELKANLTEIKNLVIEIVGNLVRIGKEIVGSLVGGMNSFQSAADSAFLSFTSGIRDALNLVSLLTTDWQKGWEAMQTIMALTWRMLIDGGRASFAALRAGAGELVNQSSRIFGILAAVVTNRFKATMETLRIAIRTAFEAGPIAARIAFARIEQAMFALANAWMKINDVMFNAQKKLFEGIVSLAGSAFKNIAKAALSAARGDLFGVAEAVGGAEKGIGGATLGRVKEDAEFLAAGTAERQRRLPELQQQLKDVLASGGQDIFDVNAKSAEEIAPLLEELGGILKDDVGGKMAEAFMANFSSDEQDALRERLAGQLEELENIREARRNRNAPVRAPQVPGGDTAAGEGGVPGSSSGSGEDPRNAPVRAPQIPDELEDDKKRPKIDTFGTFNAAAALAFLPGGRGGADGPEQKMATAAEATARGVDNLINLFSQALSELGRLRQAAEDNVIFE